MQFTPEAFPVLTPEACAFLNTPLEDCDPDILLFMFSGLTHYLMELPQDAEVADPMEVFATLWGRLGEVTGNAPPDVCPANQPEAPPATPSDTSPQASPASSQDANPAALADHGAPAAAPGGPEPTTAHDGTGPATCLFFTARALPRLMRSWWRRRFASPDGGGSLPAGNGILVVVSRRMVSPRTWRYAARASPA